MVVVQIEQQAADRVAIRRDAEVPPVGAVGAELAMPAHQLGVDQLAQLRRAHPGAGPIVGEHGAKGSRPTARPCGTGQGPGVRDTGSGMRAIRSPTTASKRPAEWRGGQAQP